MKTSVLALQNLAAIAAASVGLGALPAEGRTTADYVQTGLIAMWDGYENDGAGGYAKTLTEWKDTSGTYSFVFNVNSGIFVDDGALVFPGTQEGYAKLSAADTDATFEAAKTGTVEIVILSDPTTPQNVALQSSSQSGIAFGALARGSADANASIVTFSGSANQPLWSYNWSAGIATYSTTYSSSGPQSMLVNAEPLTKSGDNYFGTPKDETFLGHRANLTNGQAFKGRIYAIRLYSAPLTAEQIAANHAVDVERFVNGEHLSSDMLEIAGEPENCGSVTPAYGLTSGLAVGASFACTAPAAWTNEARMTSYVCAGYTVTTNGAVYLEGADASFTYTHPDCPAGAKLVWNWRRVSPPLPSGYKEVEYIESTGSQYIDLGIVGKTGVSVESKMRWMKFVNDNGYIASRKGSTRIYPVYCYPGVWEVAYNGTHIQSTVTVETANDHTVYSTLSNGCQRLLVDGKVIASNTLTGDYDTDYNLYLFGINYDGRLQYGSSSRCYTLLVWMNDELVGNFVPCYTVENGKEVIGLYNVVSKEFCPGVGAGLKRGEEVAHGDGLAITGEPDDYGTVEPAYGEVTGLAAGASFECSATPVWTNEAETVTAVCRGYKIYTDEELSDEGEETSFTYVHPQSETGSELVWQWEPKFKVEAVTVSGDGTVAVSGDGWFSSGETATVTAVPPEGKTFLSWTGEGVDPVRASENPYSFTVGAAPARLTACFAGAIYVAVDGDDANDGSSPDCALRTIEAALAAAPSEEETTIYVGPGTYEATNTVKQADDAIYAIYVDKPVKLVSLEGRENTFIDCSTSVGRAAAKLAHADAVITGFSFVNCYYTNGTKDRPTGVEGGMGTVSGCSIKTRGEWAHSGWIIKGWGTFKAYDIVMPAHDITLNEGGYAVYLKDNAVIDGFTARGTVIDGNGARQLLYLEGNAMARNVLIADCQFGRTDLASRNPLVQLNGAGAVLADSTIVNNYIRGNNGAVQVSNVKSTVTNCIVWANASTSLTNPNIQGGTNLGRFFNSCSDELTADENGNVIVDPQFVDAANGDYRLRSLSKAKDMGVVALRPSEATTLECAGDADTYVSASGESLAATFSGYCAGAQGEVSAVWNFGDGTTSTDWPTTTHTYETPGAYTVKLTMDDGVTVAVYTFARQFVCTPATCYMSTDGGDIYPYDTWEKATPSLQAALDVGSRTIVVTNGTYEIPAPVIGISRAVTLKSVEGPEKTTFTSLGWTSCDHRNLTVAGSDDILISGFAFTDGYAANYEWTASIDMSAGTLTNCVFKDIRRVSRSAACYFSGTAKVVDCVFDGHGMTWSNDSNTQSGVRIEGSAVLDRCEIFAFKIENNSDHTNYDGESPVRIASANAVLRNSYVHHCTNGVPEKANVKNRGSVGLVNGRIENCTIVDNVCAGYGGGVWAIGGAVVNSIVWNNVAGLGGDDVYMRSGTTPSFLYSCASDFEAGAAITGEGCTSKSPNFDVERPYHLTPLSTACLNAGTNLDWMTEGALDKDRLPRVVVNGAVAEDGVDMGCYEYQESTVVPLNGTVDFVGGNSGRVSYTATIEANLVGDEEGLTLLWNFGDGEPVAGGKTVTHTYEQPGTYTVTVHAANSKGEETDIAAAVPAVVVPQVCYVSKGGRGVSPYLTWEDAATNIADAVALNPKTVMVADGLYQIENDITIQSDLELRSVNGPEVTIVDAQSKCRNVWLTDQADGAVVDGFTLMRGEGYWNEKSHYARIEAGTLSHCILSNCSNNGYRDAAVLVKGKGRMSDCVVDTGNMGGNADGNHFWGTVVQSGGVIERCTIQRYNFTNQGASTLTRGAVHVEGTGVFRNCLVKDCVTTQSASKDDAYRGAVLVSGDGVVENCTVVNSTSCQPGAGLTIISGTPTVRNCIVWGAKLGDGTATTAVRDLYSPDAPRLTYSCAPELTTGEGNTAADPQFKTRRGVPYQFRSGSPCYDSALKLDWMDETAVDRIGNARIYSVAPDMGCYESTSGGLRLFVK